MIDTPTRALPAVRLPAGERIEQAALLALAFVLPLVEAPKNLLWLAYVAVWLFNRRRNTGHARWDAWDTLILLWVVAGYLGTLSAGLLDGEWHWKVDLLRNASVLWMLKRSEIDARQWTRLLLAIAAGTLVTLAFGYWGVYVSHKNTMLGLRSVGHINHSAIYLAIVFGALAMHARAGWRGMAPAHLAALAAMLALCIASLFLMNSRAAVGAAFLTVLLLLGAYALRTWRGLPALAAGAAVAVVLVVVARPQVLEKHEEFVAKGIALSHRDTVWHAGLEAWRAHPWVGVGMSRYGSFGLPEIERARTARGEATDPAKYTPTSHGHSLYVNTLAERGLLGLAALLALLAAWLAALLRRMPSAGAPPVEWSAWGGAASAWLMAVIVGTVNTTLHSEHALLSMLLLGAWLALGREKA